jgi:hypothetical protein
MSAGGWRVFGQRETFTARTLVDRGVSQPVGSPWERFWNDPDLPELQMLTQHSLTMRIRGAMAVVALFVALSGTASASPGLAKP